MFPECVYWEFSVLVTCMSNMFKYGECKGPLKPAKSLYQITFTDGVESRKIAKSYKQKSPKSASVETRKWMQAMVRN